MTGPYIGARTNQAFASVGPSEARRMNLDLNEE